MKPWLFATRTKAFSICFSPKLMFSARGCRFFMSERSGYFFCFFPFFVLFFSGSMQSFFLSSNGSFSALYVTAPGNRTCFVSTSASSAGLPPNLDRF